MVSPARSLKVARPISRRLMFTPPRRCLKVIKRLTCGKDSAGLSCIEPERYRSRFLEAIENMLVSDEDLRVTAHRGLVVASEKH